MSKNLTRKGIAFGALVALGASVFAGTPVNAAGLADKTFVSLLPNTGTEYSVLSNGTFDLKANMAQTVAGGGNLKFLVADPGSKSRAVTTSTSTAAALPTVTAAQAVFVDPTHTITTTHGFVTGDFIFGTGTTPTAGTGLEGINFVTGNTGTTVFTVTSTGLADLATGTMAIALATPTQVTRAFLLARSTATTEKAAFGGLLETSIGGTATNANTKRAADGSYVLSSELNSTTADKVIRLANTDATASLEIKVTAWVDSNDNSVIDATEYASEERTIKFLKDSDVVTTTVLEPVSVGDSTLVGSITTTPVLNGDQVGNSVATGVGAEFTRQGSSATKSAATSTWSDTTKKWTATSPALGATANTWTGLVTPTTRVDDTGLGAVTVSAAGLVTVNTAAVHDLLSGDKISFVVHGDDAGAGEIGSAATVAPVTITVTGTSSFTYTTDAVTKTAGTLDGTALDITTGYTIQTYGAGIGLADRALAGTNSVRAQLGSTGALVDAGSATAGSANTRTAAAINPEILATVNTAKTAETASQVRKGITAATVVVSITDEDGVAVAAGVNAVATISAITGTFTVNGTAVANTQTVSALTDANGQARFLVGNAAAVLDNTITLTIASEGVTGVAETLTWKDSIYAILDLADQSANGAARNRAVADTTAYTFNFLVQDQFRVAAPATLRLLVTATGNTVSTQTVAVVAGKATYSIADGGLTTSDTTVAVEFQLLTGTTWATVAGGADAYIDWNGAADNDLANVLIKYYAQIDALTLNADATSSPSTTAADFAAATTTKALVAVDARVSSALPTIVDVAGKAVVSGAVKNSVTGAAKAGQVVSFSGAGLMFKSGDVWSLGSATAIANDGTFSIDVYSNNPGTKVVTVSVGSITSSASLVFTGASSDVRKLTITGDQYPAPGSTLRAEILLVDGNGNGVNTVAPATIPLSEYISVSYNGPGLLSGAALPAETDADGKASVRYLLGTADRGSASVTVKFDANFDGDFVDATDITVTRVYNIGGSATVTAAVAGSTNRVYVSVSNNTLARNVVVKIAGTTVATLKGSTAKKTYVVPSTKGVKKVTVYVGGKLIANKTVTVK
jgi:hypothetical protein